MTAEQHYAQFEAYNTAFFHVLIDAPHLATRLRELAHESFVASQQATRERWNLPTVTDEPVPTYGVVLIADAPDATAA